MKFTKMQGLGNDYLYFFGKVPTDVSALSIRLSDRHFGVGSDGLIFIDHSDVADFSMRIFNADGSEAKMCGNGIRCVAKYVYDKGLTDKQELTIETLSGIKTLRLNVVYGKVKTVSVDMGVAHVSSPVDIPLQDMTLSVIPVSIGNPHAVVILPNVEDFPIEVYGPQIEKHELFPDGVNVEFAELTDDGIRMRVWERGSGITLACGTGASATVAAFCQRGLTVENEYIKVRLDGGSLFIKCDHGAIEMVGPAEFVCEGDSYDKAEFEL